MSELDTGLSIELWNRGMAWDKLLGVSWLPFEKIRHRSSSMDDVDILELYPHRFIYLYHATWFSFQDSYEMQISLDSELCLRDGKIISTQHPTGHFITINAYVQRSDELNQEESFEIQQKLDLLNEILEQEVSWQLESKNSQSLANYFSLKRASTSRRILSHYCGSKTRYIWQKFPSFTFILPKPESSFVPWFDIEMCDSWIEIMIGAVMG